MPFNAKFPSIGAIQNFDQTGVPAYTDAVTAIDWDGRRLFIISTTNSLVQIDSLDTPWGALVAGAAFPAGAFNLAAKYGPDGMLYGAGAAGPNDARLNKFNPAAPGTLVAFFGAVGGGFDFSTDATHWAVPFDFDVVLGPNGHAYSVSTAFNGNQTGNEVAVVDLTTMQWTGLNFFTDTNRGVVTRGLTSGGRSHAYIVSCNPATLTAGLYDVSIDAAAVARMTKIADMPATGFGPGWTHVDQASGLMLDETDGNVMCFLVESALAGWAVGTSYAVAALVARTGHDYASLVAANIGNDPATSPTKWRDLGVSGPVEQRLVKLNITTGAVMWNVVCPSPRTGPGLINSNRVRFGLYCVVEQLVGLTIHMHQIRTLQGTDTQVALNTIHATTQFFSDTTGDLIVACNSYAFIGTPVQHGSTPTPFTGFALLGSATPPFQPPGGLFVNRHFNQTLDYFTAPSAHL